MPPRRDDSTLDVAVVGGGISGLYTAWRLLCCPAGASPVIDTLRAARGAALAVAVFEMEPRLGGRLLTVLSPGQATAPVDLGALRYRADHDLVARLVEQDLQLQWAPHLVGADSIVYPTTAGADEARSASIDGEPPSLRIMREAIELVIGRDPRTVTRHEWLEVRQRGRWRGQLLTKWTLWGLLKDLLTPGKYDEVTRPFGYATSLGNWNAADALAWYGADMAGGPEYRRPAAGMQSIALALGDRVARAGGAIHCNRELDGLTVTASGAVRLRFRTPSDVNGHPSQRHTTFQARHAVLAMPPRALQCIIDGGEADVLTAPKVRRLISAVDPVPMFTICCCYGRPWWRDQDAHTQDTSPATHPLGQVLGVDPPGDRDRAGGESAALMAYNNEHTIGHWQALATAGSPEQTGTANQWMDYEAPAAVADEMHRLLRLAYKVPQGEAQPAPPFSTVCKDWTADPYGGECHAWRVHQRSWEVSRSIVQPHADIPVHICGEAYSLQQGWVEGALEHAELLLAEVFAVPPQSPDSDPVGKSDRNDRKRRALQ